MGRSRWECDLAEFVELCVDVSVEIVCGLVLDWVWICSWFVSIRFVCIWMMKSGMNKREEGASRLALWFKGIAVVWRCSGALPY